MTQQVEALLTEHFRYTPLSLIDDIINTVNTIIYRAIEAIENGLFSIPPQQLGYSPDKDTSGRDTSVPDAEHPEAKDEIENGVHQLETLLEATVDKTFDKFEIYTLRNILTVPDELAPWMRLAHYEGITLPLPANTPTPESILALRRKVQETRKLNLALRNTHANNAATIHQLHSLLSPAAQPDSETSPSSSSLSFLASDPSAIKLGLSLAQRSNGKQDTAKDRAPLADRTQAFVLSITSPATGVGGVESRGSRRYRRRLGMWIGRVGGKSGGRILKGEFGRLWARLEEGLMWGE
ncbi:hypothetical protein XPA_000625 [Xanthoria parietina]